MSTDLFRAVGSRSPRSLVHLHQTDAETTACGKEIGSSWRTGDPTGPADLLDVVTCPQCLEYLRIFASVEEPEPTPEPEDGIAENGWSYTEPEPHDQGQPEPEPVPEPQPEPAAATAPKPAEPTFRGGCSCGWRGRPVREELVALAAAEHHVERWHKPAEGAEASVRPADEPVTPIVSAQEAVQAIRTRNPFRTKTGLRGEGDDTRYVVISHTTPIAWTDEQGALVVPEELPSAVGRHLTTVRAALS